MILSKPTNATRSPSTQRDENFSPSSNRNSSEAPIWEEPVSKEILANSQSGVSTETTTKTTILPKIKQQQHYGSTHHELCKHITQTQHTNNLAELANKICIICCCCLASSSHLLTAHVVTASLSNVVLFARSSWPRDARINGTKSQATHQIAHTSSDLFLPFYETFWAHFAVHFRCDCVGWFHIIIFLWASFGSIWAIIILSLLLNIWVITGNLTA